LFIYIPTGYCFQFNGSANAPYNRRRPAATSLSVYGQSKKRDGVENEAVMGRWRETLRSLFSTEAPSFSTGSSSRTRGLYGTKSGEKKFPGNTELDEKSWGAGRKRGAKRCGFSAWTANRRPPTPPMRQMQREIFGAEAAP